MRELLIFGTMMVALTGNPGRPRAAPAPGDHLRVELLTIGPGPATWSRFGHSAIRVQDLRGRGDIVFDFGTFDDEQPNVIGRFLQGRLQYSLSVSTFRQTVTDYSAEGRRIEAQELQLTGPQRLRLFRRLRRLVRPENRNYRYHHFDNNCATRIRDELDRVLGGPIQRQLRRVPAATYRYWIHRATRGHPGFHLGFDLILTHADGSISLWEAAFAPEALRDGVARVWLRSPGGARIPLVRSSRLVHKGAGFGTGGGDSRAWFLAGLWLLLLFGMAPLLLPRHPVVARILGGLSLGIWGLIQTLGCAAILFLQLYSTLEQFRGNPHLAVFAPVGPLLCWAGMRQILARRTGWRAPRWLLATIVAYFAVILIARVSPGPPNPWPQLWLVALVLQAGFFLTLVLTRRSPSP